MTKKIKHEPKQLRTSIHTAPGSTTGNLLRQVATIANIREGQRGWANEAIETALSDYVGQHPQPNEIPHFDFTVAGMTRAQADALLNIIVSTVEAFGLDMGGGFVMEESEADDEKET